MTFKNRRYLALIAVVVAVAAGAVFLYRSPEPEPAVLELKAAIVDGLSVEFPNIGFVEEATTILSSRGYEVDYYNSSGVTVDLYKSLPEKGYSLVLLRIHGAPMDGNEPGAAFFTTEDQQGLYQLEQLLGWVRRAVTLTRGERYYAVTPVFFMEGMKGRFNDTVIVAMSCYGTIDDTLPRVFIGKGAYAYLGWDGKVTAQYMDEVTLVLLEEYLGKGNPLQDAARYIAREYGVDPSYGSRLLLYLRE